VAPHILNPSSSQTAFRVSDTRIQDHRTQRITRTATESLKQTLSTFVA